MRFAESLVNCKSLERRQFGAFPVPNVERVRFGQTNICKCVVWIFVKSSLEITYTQMSSFRGSLAQVEAAGLVRFISIDVRRFASRYWFPFIGVCLRR